MKYARSALTLLFALACSLFASAPARAADSATASCVESSNASLDLGDAHRLRAERAALLVCLRAECPNEIRKECIHRMDQLDAALPTAVFDARDAAGNSLKAVRISMDGELLVDLGEGGAAIVDPGEHTFTFEATGLPILRKTLVFREGQKNRREAVIFGTELPRRDSHPQPLPPPPLLQESRAVEVFGTQRWAAVGAFGLGAIAIGIGSGYGLDASSRRSEAEAVCPGRCPDQSGVDDWNRARASATASTIAFAVAGAGIVGGTVLWLTSSPRSNVEVGMALGGLRLGGRW